MGIVSNYDDNNDNEAVETDAQQPLEAGQPDNLANQDDADDEDDPLEIPGVDEETIDPKTPGVGENGEEMEDEELINHHQRYHLREKVGEAEDTICAIPVVVITTTDTPETTLSLIMWQ